MEIKFDNLYNVNPHLSKIKVVNQTSSPQNSYPNYGVNTSLCSKSMADCCKVYSNISFGSRSPELLERQLNGVCSYYQKLGAIKYFDKGFISKFAERLINKPKHIPLVIFFEGASGSGKSTNANALNKEINLGLAEEKPKSVIIAGDNFYTDNEEVMRELNYDFLSVVKKHPERETPAAFDLVCAYNVLNSIRDEQTQFIKVPKFDHKHSKRITEELIRKPDTLIIFDSLYAPEDFKFDARIFIDTDRMTRDARVGGKRFKERHPESMNPEADGKTLAQIVGNTHDKCIIPNRNKADLVIDGNYDIKLLTRMYEDIVEACVEYI